MNTTYTNLGEIVTEFRKIQSRENACYDDMYNFNAPTECGELISKHFKNELRLFLNKHNFTVETWNELILKRTSDKFAYTFSLLLNDF